MNFSRTKNKNLLLSESKFNLTIRLYIAGFAPWSRTGGSFHKLQPCSSKDWPGRQSSNNVRHPNHFFRISYDSADQFVSQ